MVLVQRALKLSAFTEAWGEPRPQSKSIGDSVRASTGGPVSVVLLKYSAAKPVSGGPEM